MDYARDLASYILIHLRVPRLSQDRTMLGINVSPATKIDGEKLRARLINAPQVDTVVFINVISVIRSVIGRANARYHERSSSGRRVFNRCSFRLIFIPRIPVAIFREAGDIYGEEEFLGI